LDFLYQCFPQTNTAMAEDPREHKPMTTPSKVLLVISLLFITIGSALLWSHTGSVTVDTNAQRAANYYIVGYYYIFLTAVLSLIVPPTYRPGLYLLLAGLVFEGERRWMWEWLVIHSIPFLVPCSSAALQTSQSGRTYCIMVPFCCEGMLRRELAAPWACTLGACLVWCVNAYHAGVVVTRNQIISWAYSNLWRIYSQDVTRMTATPSDSQRTAVRSMLAGAIMGHFGIVCSVIAAVLRVR
jgi:hypothetical protein